MSSRLVTFAEDDPLIARAIEEAQRSLPQFFEAYSAPESNQSAFLVKVMCEVGEHVEHIWVADIDASVFPLQGTIANEPNLPGLRFMDRLEFHPSRITDWMYIEDGYLVGGFTTKAIRSTLSADERAAFDAGKPYRFRD